MIWDAKTGREFPIQARAVLLATGGLGRVFLNTTNPDVATGDGVAMAYRAGAEISDIEFVQFHPTALAVEGAPRFLLSEALRGEGAVLKNTEGERLMERYHDLPELAPRERVAAGRIGVRGAGGPRHARGRGARHQCSYGAGSCGCFRDGAHRAGYELASSDPAHRVGEVRHCPYRRRAGGGARMAGPPG